MTQIFTVNHVTRKTSLNWEVSPFVTFRVNSLPAALEQILRFPRTVQTLQALQEGCKKLTAVMHAEAEKMTLDVQQAGEHQELRRALINARRQLHQGAAPKARDLEALQVHWELQRTGALLDITREASRMDTLQQGLSEVMFREYLACQQQVKDLIKTHPDFAASLDCTVPEVAETLLSYLQAPSSQTLQEWRKFELTLTTYLTRAALKTSPLSRLTYTALVDLSQKGRGEQVEVHRVRSRVQLQGALLRKLFLHTTSHPAFATFQRYSFNPDLREEEGMWKVYVRKVVSADTMQDTTIVLPAKSALKHLREAMLDRPFWSLSELQNLLGLQNDAPLMGLIEQGLLVPEIQYADDLPDPLATLSLLVQRSADGLAPQLLEQLKRIQQAVAGYAPAHAPERRKLRQQLVQAVQQVFDLLEVQERFTAQRLLYENAAADVELPAQTDFSLPEDDLQQVATMISLFGFHQEARLEQVKSFVDRYGVGGTCREPETFLLKALPAQTDPCGIDQMIQDLHSQRMDFLKNLQAAVQHSAGEDVEVQPDWFATPRFVSPLELALQHTPQGDLVLNGVLYGQHNALSRVWPLLQNSETFVRFLQSQQVGPVIRAQLVVSSHNSMNQFPTLFDVALKAPGTAPACHALREMRLSELELHHEPASHSLKLKTKDGQTIEPVYVGSYTPFLMGTIDRAMVGLSEGSQASFSPVEMLESLAPELPAESIRFYPRIRMGRVILSRKTWVLGSAKHLQRQKNETELAYWQRLLRFWQDQGHPTAFFAVPTTRGLRLQGTDSSPYKPQSFDLESFWSIRSFEKWIVETKGSVYVQEMLPRPEDAFVHHQQAKHVSEFCVRLHPHKETPHA